MALLTDGTISSLEDLRGYESSIYELATTEKIDLTRKLELAQQELAIELSAKMFRDSPGDLYKVVVTPALKLWHIFHSLALVYRDSYHSQLNDRYEKKWKEYERLAKWAYDNLLKLGVGMVDTPVPKAQPPEVELQAGESAPGTYWLRISWVGVSGPEGCPSDLKVVEVVEGLIPTVATPVAPPGVAGWNLYASYGGETTRLQNSYPLGLTERWVMPASGLREDGKVAGDGQAPSYYIRPERLLRRG